MTRVNVVPVEELCDQMLLAEHREITRIPNTVVSGRAKVRHIEGNYRLGTGHVAYFYTRLGWLEGRYKAVHDECLRRGFNVTYRWPENVPEKLKNNWTPTDFCIKLNRERIEKRLPANARWTL